MRDGNNPQTNRQEPQSQSIPSAQSHRNCLSRFRRPAPALPRSGNLNPHVLPQLPAFPSQNRFVREQDFQPIPGQSVLAKRSAAIARFPSIESYEGTISATAFAANAARTAFSYE